MGLSRSSVGRGALDTAPTLRRRAPDDAVVALAGNPNVGKSTVFNALTGMHQHTGNWPGKTVSCAQGYLRSNQHGYVLVDIPGTYSLRARSAEEELARNFICFAEPDAVVVVCDATCLERNLHLVLQIMEAGARTVVCVNLMDEARRKHIRVDLEGLRERLGVPVVGVTARKKKTLVPLLAALDSALASPLGNTRLRIPYPDAVEEAIAEIEAALDPSLLGRLDSRWLALRLLEDDSSLQQQLTAYLGWDAWEDPTLTTAKHDALARLSARGIDRERLQDLLIVSAVSHAETLAREVTDHESHVYSPRDRRLDRILTGRLTGYPVMLLRVGFIFWLTISASNLPSSYLSAALFGALEKLSALFVSAGMAPWLNSLLTEGVLRVLAWVVSVMLPPMAIFFPLFTLLEDAGYLPRVAYNLDRPFQRCNACGKQALSMCMGFGCNAAGVVGCRIIDSPRERLLAILTNSLVPCNGRFPALISIITLFLVGTAAGLGQSVLSACLLTAVILVAVLATLALTKLLSKTLLRGVPSSFTLEMPPFRPPQVGKILVRSVFDRTLFVLGRSVMVAAPAGALIWLMANLTVNEVSLLSHCAACLEPIGRFLGMDGTILLAFILGFPANEIVIPLAVMIYRSGAVLQDPGDLAALGTVLRDAGWTPVTAVCVLIFFLFHWPCSTTLLTVKKETGSIGWTLLAAALPTLLGASLCALVAVAARLFGA